MVKKIVKKMNSAKSSIKPLKTFKEAITDSDNSCKDSYNSDHSDKIIDEQDDLLSEEEDEDESDIIDFGKFKDDNITIDQLIRNEPAYSFFLYKNVNLEDRPNIKRALHYRFKDCNEEEYFMSWGKHKNKELSWIRKHDDKYIDYLKKNKYVKENCPALVRAIHNQP